MANISDTMDTYVTFNSKYGNNIIPKDFPMEDAIVTQGFNDKNTQRKGHLGYDLQTTDNLARAIFDGTIVKMAYSNSNGNVVIIRHQIGTTVFYSGYAHLANFNANFHEGDRVSCNADIGTIGHTGSSAGDYSHLHLCVFTDGQPTVDFMGYCHYSTASFQETAGKNANEYYYGNDETKFPNCGGLCFYDPYAVVSTNGAVFRHSGYSIYDVNHDGAVNQLDLTRAQRNYGRYDPLSDINGDGTVNISDLILIMNNYDS